MSDQESIAGETDTAKPKPGRVTAVAPTIWACPLASWQLGDDDGCDPIETGTAIKIHKQGVRPELPHGPFALIEYTHGGVTKIQYVIDSTVTPLGEDDPTVEDAVDRTIKGWKERERSR
jgi:hypothetical protein